MFNLVLFALIIAVAAYTVVIAYQANSLNRLVTETNEQQRESIAQISQATMDSVISSTMGQSTQMEAMIADSPFQKPANTVKMLADYVSRGRFS